MINTAFHEQKTRGSFAFPIEYYFVDRHHPRYEMPFHWHTEYELIAVSSGNFNLSLDGEEMILDAGECSIIQSGVIHGGAPSDAVYECLVFDLPGLLDSSEMSKQLYALLESGRLTRKFSQNDDISLIVLKIIAAMKQKQIGYELEVKGFTYLLLSSIISNGLLAERRDFQANEYKRIIKLKNVLHYIRENYQHPISLKELAKNAEMSPKYFCRFFREMVNKTPIDYLNYYRIERACEILSRYEKNITETAFECGFNDISYFIKTFKKYKGCSPKKYINEIKSK